MIVECDIKDYFGDKWSSGYWHDKIVVCDYYDGIYKYVSGEEMLGLSFKSAVLFWKLQGPIEYEFYGDLDSNNSATWY